MLTSRTAPSSQGTRRGRRTEEVIPGPGEQQEGKGRQSGKVKTAGGLVWSRVGLILPLLQCSLKGQMAGERTEWQSFHSAAEIPFISLPGGWGGSLAEDWVRALPKPKACPWGWGTDAGSREETPAVISLVVSRYQKNSRVWEKTYPGCRGVQRGESRGAPRIRTRSRRPRRAKRGGRRRPAAQVASPAAPGGQGSR